MVHEVIISALATVVLSFLTVNGAAQLSCPSGFITAECQLRTNPSTANPPHQITGTVTFRQRVTASCRRLGMLVMRVQVEGLQRNADGQYGLHVHESADLTNGCESYGPHYNPIISDHGGPTDSFDMRHMGDFGNLRLNERGQVDQTSTDYLANLLGRHNIIGRGLVLHAMRDDLGLGGVPASLTTGNSGARLACCEIRQT
ncbi:hypothetical protein ACJMK2_028427 [Sinanodonta woodiana]|uniref:Superoxide dismutase copper/zinc binding domain-containing protein n=1 Tax=Sinanodonta woodiana TaxID=1069815 RepID=A0ABD3XAM9_SINWO